MKSLLRKIKAGNRTQAAIWALNQGLAPGLPFGKPAQAPRAASRSEARVLAPMMRSEEHTSELPSLMRISYAVFCLKKKKNNHTVQYYTYSDTTTTTIN